MEQTKDQNVGTAIMINDSPDAVVDSGKMSAGASMPVSLDGSYAYARPAGIDFLSSKFTMSAILLVLFLLLTFNAYYLRKKQKSTGDIGKSIIWTNALVAIFVISLSAYLYYSFRLEVNWQQTIMTT